MLSKSKAIILPISKKRNMTASRTIKIIASGCFVLLVVALLAILNSPATGFEASIYEATPLVVWGCLIFSIACGIGIVVHQVHSQRESNNLWVIGLVLILLSTTIILSLHILRGYVMIGLEGDPGTHLGRIQDVIASGYAERESPYPIAHIFLTQLSLVTGSSPTLWHQWTPVLFTLLYMGFIYFLAKSVLPNRGQVILATVAGTVLIHGWYLNLTPNHLSNSLFPLVLYLLVRSFTPGTIPWKLLFLVMVFLIPPFHPVPAIALVIVLWTLSLPGKLLTSTSQGASGFSDNRLQFNAAVSILVLVFTIMWLSSFGLWSGVIRNIQKLVTEGGPTAFTALMEAVGPGVEHTYSVAWQFFLHYASIIVYIVLALIAFLILWRRRANSKNLAGLWGLYGPLITFALFIVILFFLNLPFGPLRILIYIIIICTIFVGFSLCEFMKRVASHHNWRAKIVPLLIAVLLLGVSINGIVVVYGSPYIIRGNPQATLTNIQGMDYLLHHYNTDLYITYWTVTISRYDDFLMTPEERETVFISSDPTENRIPHHFGYDKHQLIGQSYEKDRYVIISQRDRAYCTEMFPELAEEYFLPEDFVRLENDISIDKLYVNGGFDFWFVHAMD